MNKLFIFDLDGTLTESKQALTAQMANLLAKFLDVTRVGIISGGALEQFIKQVVSHLPKYANLKNLYLLPTSGAALYEYKDEEWKKVYEERLSEREAHAIESAIREAAVQTGIINFSDQSWGERIEYRGGQVTLSALGQQAPIALKKAWDPDHAKRHALRDAVAERLPKYSVVIGGATSIDVSKQGIDKAYGVHKLCDRLGIPESEALYVGDELENGGNDEAVYKTSVQTKSVATVSDTEKLIGSLLTTT